MYKKLLLCLLLFLSFSGLGQTNGTLSLATEGGYEYNYFKSPTQVLMNDTIFDASFLISSSIIQNIDLKYRYSKKWGKHRFRFLANPNASIFFENLDDSFWSLWMYGKYDYRLTKKTKFLAEVNFKRMDREGLNGAQDVLINPLGYTNYGGALGLQFKPIKKNTSMVEVFYNFRNYDTYGIRDLAYNELGVGYSSAQWFRMGRLKHRFGVNGYFKKRLYNTFNASEIDSEGERDWSYLNIEPFYSYPLSDQFQIEGSFQFYQRFDNLINRSGFLQLGPELNAKFNNKRTKMNFNTSFITRNYDAITARNTAGDSNGMVKYEYVNFRWNASHQISNQLKLTATLQSRIRTTNNTNIRARSFRNYRNQVAVIGFNWSF